MFFSNIKCEFQKECEKIAAVPKTVNRLVCTAAITGLYGLFPKSVFAAGAEITTIKSVLDKFIDIIGTIFIALGIILAAFSIGQLVLSFKNEDADSKSRAATLLVVSIILIAIRPIIAGLGLTDMLN